MTDTPLLDWLPPFVLWIVVGLLWGGLGLVGWGPNRFVTAMGILSVAASALLFVGLR